MLRSEDERPAGATRSADIKGWARAALGLPDEAVVLVTELRCAEPGCPPLETVIAVLDDGAGGRVQVRLHAPIAALVEADVVGALAR